MYSQNSTHKLLLKTKFQGGLVKMQLQKEVFSEGLDVEYIYIYIHKNNYQVENKSIIKIRP